MKRSIVVMTLFLVHGGVRAQDGAALTPKSLNLALAAKPEGAEAERLADRIRVLSAVSVIRSQTTQRAHGQA